MTLLVIAPDGVPEVAAGDDLASLLLAACTPEEGDVVVVTSKVVSKAEGRVREGGRDQALADETLRVVARRGGTAIVRNRIGLVMAAAGVDASNVTHGSVALLPEDPDRSARRLRAELHRRTGVNTGVLITDTAGRAWRVGQTDIAIGAAGLVVAEDFQGRHDGYGNSLAVTLPAVADEIAGAAELAQGKLGGRPFALVRGRADLVLPPGDDGAGAVALQRAEGEDMFGYGAREAVVAAVLGIGPEPFGAPTSRAELVSALALLDVRVGPPSSRGDGPGVQVSGERLDLVRVLAFAHGWSWVDNDSGILLRLPPITT